MILICVFVQFLQCTMVLSSACSGSKSVDANAILSPVNIYKVSFGYINIQTLYLLFKNKLAYGRLAYGASVVLLNSVCLTALIWLKCQQRKREDIHRRTYILKVLYHQKTSPFNHITYFYGDSISPAAPMNSKIDYPEYDFCFFI